MTNNLQTTKPSNAEIIEQVMISGNLASLSPEQRVQYYNNVCESLGLNRLTKPFDFIQLNGKLTLYARKDATDQLRKINRVSITIKSQKEEEGIFIVNASATDKHGKQDEDVGAVNIKGLTGEARANAIMKAITKAKRRVTLSICGMGFLDETEVETIPEAREYLANQKAQVHTEVKTAALTDKISAPTPVKEAPIQEAEVIPAFPSPKKGKATVSKMIQAQEAAKITTISGPADAPKSLEEYKEDPYAFFDDTIKNEKPTKKEKDPYDLAEEKIRASKNHDELKAAWGYFGTLAKDEIDGLRKKDVEVAKQIVSKFNKLKDDQKKSFETANL